MESVRNVIDTIVILIPNSFTNKKELIDSLSKVKKSFEDADVSNSDFQSQANSVLANFLSKFCDDDWVIAIDDYWQECTEKVTAHA